MRNKTQVVSVSILIFVFTLFLCSSLGFIVGLPINKAYMFVALGSVVVYWFISIQRWKDRIWVACLFWLIVLVSLGISILIYDSSYDGKSYHQLAMFYLKNGWNPVYQTISQLKAFQDFSGMELWIEHYNKFFEIVGANFYLWSGRIESAKALNILLTLASMGCAFSVLKLFDKKYTWFFVFALAFTPVVVPQIFTNYVDGCLSSLLLVAFVAILGFEKERKKLHLAIFAMSLIMASSVKLTGFAYSGMIGLGYLIYLFLIDRTQVKKLLICGVLCGFGIIVCNANPFLTNLKKGEHIFYPLMGEKKLDILTPFMAKEFAQKNRFEQLLISIFSKTQYIGIDSNEPKLKIPFTFNQNEIHLGATDTSIGGFGFLFSGILILSLISLLFGLKTLSKQEKNLLILLSVLILITTIINPAPWWARYVPQLWFLPIFYFFFTSKTLRIIPILGLMISCFNIADAATFAWGRNLVYTFRMYGMFKVLKDKNLEIYFERYSPDKSMVIKMREKGIKVEFSPTKGEDFQKVPLIWNAYWNVENAEIQLCDIKSQIRQYGFLEGIKRAYQCFVQK